MEIVLAEPKECTGCSACMSICPQNAIRMVSDSEGFLIPVINPDLCTQCGLCVKTCPVINPLPPPSVPVAFFAAMHVNEEVRMKSSSGGVFSALAETILAEGGVVAGAAFDETFRLRHIFVSNVDQLDQLRGSKYVQSDLEQTFREVRDVLRVGRRILFTGTPCQIAGLKRFLGTANPLLVCADLICHGVPSPLTWQKFLGTISDIHPRRVFFRDKSKGWHKLCLRIEASIDSLSVVDSFDENAYFGAFLANLGLRYSCYACKFKQGGGHSDLTIGDFWGVEHIAPELDDDKGISVVVAHSDGGLHLLKRSAVKLFPVDQNQALRYNPLYFSSVHRPFQLWRWWFFERVRKGEFSKVARILSAVVRLKGLYHRGKGKLKLILRKYTGLGHS